jgi:hypothetical protein
VKFGGAKGAKVTHLRLVLCLATLSGRLGKMTAQ